MGKINRTKGRKNMLIVIAEKEELKLVEELGYSNCPVLITGVGALNVIDALKDLPKDTEILNIGYAGSANYGIGSAVCVTEVRQNHPCVSYPEPELLLQVLPAECMQKAEEVIESVCYSNTDFVLQSNYRDCVFDMELAFILGMGFTNVRSIKIVSDNLSLREHRQHINSVE